MAVDIPEVWCRFGIMVHQDFLLEHDDVFLGFASVVKELPANDINVLYLFLSEIQAAALSTWEKALLWEKSGAEIFVVGEEVHSFFSKLLETVENCRQSKSQAP